MPIPKFDPNQPYETIHGPAPVLRGAKYIQNGITYNGAYRPIAHNLFPQPDPVDMPEPAPELTDEQFEALQQGQPAPQMARLTETPAAPPEGLENWNKPALKKALDARGVTFDPTLESSDLAKLLAENWSKPIAGETTPNPKDKPATPSVPNSPSPGEEELDDDED